MELDYTSDIRALPPGTLDEEVEKVLIRIRLQHFQDRLTTKTLEETKTPLEQLLKEDPICLNRAESILMAQHTPCDKALVGLNNRLNLTDEVQDKVSKLRRHMKIQLASFLKKEEIDAPLVGLDSPSHQPFSHLKQWRNFVFNPQAGPSDRLIMTRSEFLEIYKDDLPEDWQD